MLLRQLNINSHDSSFIALQRVNQRSILYLIQSTISQRTHNTTLPTPYQNQPTSSTICNMTNSGYIEKCDLVWGDDGEPHYLNSNFELRVEREAVLRSCGPTILGLRTKRDGGAGNAGTASERVSRSSSMRKSVDDDDDAERRLSNGFFTSKFTDRVRRISLSKSPRNSNVGASASMMESRSVHINSR